MGVFFVAGCRRSRLLGQFLLHSSPRWHLVQWLHTGAMLQSFVGLREVWFHSAFEALWLARVWLECSRLALRPGEQDHIPRGTERDSQHDGGSGWFGPCLHGQHELVSRRLGRGGSTNWEVLWKIHGCHRGCGSGLLGTVLLKRHLWSLESRDWCIWKQEKQTCCEAGRLCSHRSLRLLVAGTQQEEMWGSDLPSFPLRPPNKRWCPLQPLPVTHLGSRIHSCAS